MIDFGGIQGPSKSVISASTTIQYGQNRGVLLNIPEADKNLPGVHAAPKISVKQITDGLSKTMLVAELTGRAYNISKSELAGVWADGNNVFAIQGQINLDPVTEAWVHDEIFSDHPGGRMDCFAMARRISSPSISKPPSFVGWPCVMAARPFPKANRQLTRPVRHQRHSTDLSTTAINHRGILDNLIV